MSIESIIRDIIKVEGGYSNDPSDSGGETCWGITVAVARANGYAGAMKDMPQQVAYDIYYKQYVVAPNFDKIAVLSEAIAAELVDTGVNMGVGVASKFLQQSLNALNDSGTQYPDLVVDGAIGKGSISALQAFLAKRGTEGQVILNRALNALQGARYISIAETSPKNERFVYGWLKNRVVI
jgi:lysozyme family protein